MFGRRVRGIKSRGLYPCLRGLPEWGCEEDNLVGAEWWEIAVGSAFVLWREVVRVLRSGHRTTEVRT